MMSQSRLDELPLVHSENLLPVVSVPPPPPFANGQNDPNSQPSEGVQGSSSINSADDSLALGATGTTGASEGTSSGNRSGVQGETSALEGESRATMGGTVAVIVLGSLLALICIGLIIRRQLRKRPSKNLPGGAPHVDV